MQDESESELIAQAKAGAHGAFESLVLRYQDFMVNFIYRMTRDKDTALEQAQESFVKAYKSINGFKNQSSFRTWLASIALNYLLLLSF